jgi:hypothetical protein
MIQICSAGSNRGLATSVICTSIMRFFRLGMRRLRAAATGFNCSFARSAVSKTVVQVTVTVGSNPTLSASAYWFTTCSWQF